jgi:FMN-dependent NADH-azoreductase
MKIISKNDFSDRFFANSFGQYYIKFQNLIRKSKESESMTKLLYVDAHPLTSNESKSLLVGESFVESWKTAHPEGKVETIKLFEADIPSLNKEVFDTWVKNKQIGAGAPLELTAEEKARLIRFDELIQQFIESDVIAFANPMWNHFLPPILKQYLDAVIQVGVAFKYTANGPVGLLSDKTFVHIQSAGGVYDHETNEHDFGDAYLREMARFIGLNPVTDFKAVFIEGADAFPEKRDAIIAEASKQAEEIAKSL